MAASVYDMMIKLSAVDKASGVIAGIQQKVGGFNNNLASFGLAASGIREVAGVMGDFSKGFTELDTATQAMKALGQDGERLAPILKQVSTSMAQDIPFAASEIQGAMTDALASGIEPTEKGLSVFANTAAKLAAGSGTELGVVVKGLAGTLNAYGASASEATKYTDIFFDVNNAGVTSIRELNAYMPALNASAAALGLSFADAGRSIALMTQKGVSTADSSTAIKALFQEMAKPSGDFEKFMQNAGISMEQIQSGPLEKRLQIIRAGLEKTGQKVDTIFGSSEAATAIKVMTGDMKKMSDVFAQVNELGSGSSSNAFQKMQESVAVQTKQMESRLDAFKIKALDSMGGFGVGFVTATNQLGKMSGEITALAGLKALIPPGAFEGLRNVAGPALSSLASSAGTAVSSMRTAFSNGLLSMRIGWANFGNTLKNASLSGVWSSISSGGAQALSSLRSGMAGGISAVAQFGSAQIAALRASSLFSGGITGFASTVGGSLATGIRSAVTGVMSMNAAFLTSPVLWIAIAIAGAAFLIYKNWGAISGYFSGLFEGIKGAASGFMDGLSAAFAAPWAILQEVGAAFKPIWDAISALFAPVQAVSGAAGSAGKQFSWMRDVGVIAGQYLGTAFRVIATPILYIIGLVGETISILTGLTTSGSAMAMVLAGAFTAIVAPIQLVINGVWQLFQFIQAIFSGTSLKEAGVNMIMGLWEGIKATWDKLVGGVKGLVSGFTSLFTGKKDDTAKAAATPPKPEPQAAAQQPQTQAPKVTPPPAAAPPVIKPPKTAPPPAFVAPSAASAAPKLPKVEKIAGETQKKKETAPKDEAVAKPAGEGINKKNNAVLKAKPEAAPDKPAISSSVAPETTQKIAVQKPPIAAPPTTPSLGTPNTPSLLGSLGLGNIGDSITQSLSQVDLLGGTVLGAIKPTATTPVLLNPQLAPTAKEVKAPNISPLRPQEDTQQATLAVRQPASPQTQGIEVNLNVTINVTPNQSTSQSEASAIAEEVKKVLPSLKGEIARAVSEALERDRRLQFTSF